MAKKKFIRHLEFYGFPDQNVYVSDSNGCGCNVDLSEIISKNKEQDKEIKDLTDDKANQKDLLELSGTVKTMIETQSGINQELFDAVSGQTGKIQEITDAVNDMGDIVNGVVCDLQNLSDKVDGIDSDVAELSGKVETLSAETADAISGMQESIDGKLDKEEADETYMKKGESYTKDETDAKIAEELEPYATREWVDEKGFMTQEQADERYAKKTEMDALSNRLDMVQSGLSNDIFALSGKVETLSSETNTRINTLNTNFNTLSSEVNRKVNEISGTVDTLSAKVNRNTDDIRDIQDELARKADKVDLENLQTRVSNLSDIVDNKVSKPEFETYKAQVTNNLNDLDDRKADKSALDDTNDRIDDLDAKIGQEKADRISGDTYIINIISGITQDIEDLREEDRGYDERISDLEDGLAQEIIDRKQADLDLIGNETDLYDYDTIWGAKNFAKNQKRLAVNEAKAYTDQEVGGLRSDVNEQFEQIEQEISGFATKQYVDNSRNELKTELTEQFNTAIQAEQERAEGEELNLLTRILKNESAITENDDAIDHLADRVNAITVWDGVDPEEYDDSGNGVLDVLHREFHEFEQTAGSIKEIKVEDGLFIITYYTKDGEKTTEIPVAEFVDLSDYYTKEETDAAIQDAIQHIELDNYYTKDETDAAIQDAIQELVLDNYYTKDETDAKVDAVVGNASSDYDTLGKTEGKIEELIEKLGYDDNDTLVRMNEHEVAFGEYNMSVNSPDPAEQTIFSIGNGTSESDRKNAIEVRKNGDVYMWVEDEYVKVNDLLAMLTHETY